MADSLSNLNVVINGNKVTFSTEMQLKSILNKGIDNVINGSEENDTIYVRNIINCRQDFNRILNQNNYLNNYFNF